MTSAAGSNPESSEPVLDLETQLDDLLNQIDKAEPGLLNTPAPTTQAQAVSKTTDENGQDASDDDDEMDFEGAFETVETLDDAIAESSFEDLNDDAGNEPTQEAEITAELDDLIQEENQDEEAADDDEGMFSPEDFITTEEVSEEEHAMASHADDSESSHNNTIDNVDDEADDEGQDALGMDLASQIQQLLDDARTDGSDAKSKPEVKSEAVTKSDYAGRTPSPPSIVKPAFAETAASITDDEEPDMDGDFTAPAEEEMSDSEDLAGMLDAIAEAVARPENNKQVSVDAVASPSDAKSQMASPPVPFDDDEDTASMSLEDIDQMLADEADEAVAGDFETISDVVAPIAAASDAADKKKPALQAADANASQNKDALAQDTDAADDDELDFDGSFETTQDIITQDDQQSTRTGGAGNFSADAAAVARELDDQPERQNRNANGSKNSAGSSGVAGRISKTSSLAAFSKVPDVARSVCVTISRPMEAVAPQTRDLVGYVGLITLFWGSVTVIVKLIFAVNN